LIQAETKQIYSLKPQWQSWEFGSGRFNARTPLPNADFKDEAKRRAQFHGGPAGRRRSQEGNQVFSISR
jgi:hypothetical protein